MMKEEMQVEELNICCLCMFVWNK
jgi:hypothetical protein